MAETIQEQWRHANPRSTGLQPQPSYLPHHIPSDSANGHPLDVDRQIDRLLSIKPGWLDGDGESPDPGGLAWLREVLHSRTTFNSQIVPYLYPTEDGNVQAEWTIGTVSADLEINLANHHAIWGWSDLSSSDSGERFLDLNEETNWIWLSKTLTSLAETSGK